jgi:hypothetical protein
MTLRQELEQLQSRTQTLMRVRQSGWRRRTASTSCASRAASSLNPARKSPNTCSSCWSASAKLSLSVMKSAPQARRRRRNRASKPAGRFGRSAPERAGGTFWRRTAVRNLRRR